MAALEAGDASRHPVMASLIGQAFDMFFKALVKGLSKGFKGPLVLVSQA
jgi:hypothetical protein